MMWRLLIVVWTLSVSRHLSHQPSQQEKYRTHNGVVGIKHRDCTGIHTGNDECFYGSEKVPTTPTTSTAKWQDLDQERPSTRNTFWESQQISAKYIRYIKLLKGKSVTLTDLGIFSQFDGILSSIENVVTSTFQAIQKLPFTKTCQQKVRNIWQIATLQIYWCVV